MCYIYGLFSTEDNKIRYIGQTKSSLGTRLSSHKYDALKKNAQNHKCNWIRSIYKKGYILGITCIEKCNKKDLNNKEIEWISKLKEECNLVNQLKGGNSGGIGGKMKNYLSYNDAKLLLRDYKELYSQDEYHRNFDKFPELKDKIPKHPEDVYKLRGEWKGFRDYLEFVPKPIKIKKDYGANYKSYEEASKFAVEHHFLYTDEYKKYIKDNELNKIYPLYPNKVYKDKGWTNWYNFVSNNGEINIKIEMLKRKTNYVDYETAKRIIKKYNLSSFDKYIELLNSSTDIELKQLPRDPFSHYKRTNEWKNFQDYLGKERKRKKCTIEVFRRYINIYFKNKINSVEEWKKLFYDYKISNGIPRRPDLCYGLVWSDIFPEIKKH